MAKTSVLYVISVCIICMLGWRVSANAFSVNAPPEPSITLPQQITPFDVNVINNFPFGITVQISPVNDVIFEDLRLSYQIKGQANKTGYRIADDPNAVPVEITIESQRAGTYIPPGTTIYYSIEGLTSTGLSYESPESKILYLDPGFTWSTLSNDLSVIYYHGGPSSEEANVTQQVITETAEFALPMFGHDPTEQFHLVLYENYRDMEKVLPFRSDATSTHLMTQGMAFPEERVAVIYAGTNTLKSTTAHEFMHLLLHDAVGRFHTRLPAWFDEGLAEFGNLYRANDYESPLREAISSKTDKSIKFLNTFSGSPEDIIAAYGKGASVVTYLADTFGRNSFADLITNFKASISIEKALQATYDLSIDELEAAWAADRQADMAYPADDQVNPTKSKADQFPSRVTTEAPPSCSRSKERAPLDFASVLLIVAPIALFFRRGS